VDPRGHGDKAGTGVDSPGRPRFQLNGRVTDPAQSPTTTYGLAPALGARLVGRSLISLAVLVALATLLGLLTDLGWRLAGVVTVVGVVLIGLWSLYLFRRAWAVRLTDGGYAVRLLGGVGVTAASWDDVEEVVAATPAGRPCLVIRLRDGRATRLPATALAGDRDAFALDVRRRVRAAHTPEAPGS
jgi:hypothetical protein